MAEQQYHVVCVGEDFFAGIERLDSLSEALSYRDGWQDGYRAIGSSNAYAFVMESEEDQDRFEQTVGSNDWIPVDWERVLSEFEHTFEEKFKKS